MKDLAAYRALLDRKIKTGVLTLNEQERENVERFYLDFPVGKEIVNRLGERVFLQPRPDGDVHEYIHHFAVKRGRRVDGSYWENYSETHLALFGEIEKTVAEFDDRLIGGTDIKDKDGKIIGVSPRLYFVRDIGKNHLVTVSVEPKTMLLTWTHMTPSNEYLRNHRSREEELFARYGAFTEDGAFIADYQKYEELKKILPCYLAVSKGEIKKDVPLFLATAQGQQNPLLQAADSVAIDSIAQSNGKIKGIAPAISEEMKKDVPLCLATAQNSKRLLHQPATSSVASIIAQPDEKFKGIEDRLKPLYLATALGQQNPSHQAADSVATDSIAQPAGKIKGIAPGKQQEEKKMNEITQQQEEKANEGYGMGM